jgi:hypothetical protein
MFRNQRSSISKQVAIHYVKKIHRASTSVCAISARQAGTAGAQDGKIFFIPLSSRVIG